LASDDVGRVGLTVTTPDVREAARRLIEDPQYVEALKERLRLGLAGPMEPMLWRYAHGDPKIHHRRPLDDGDLKRFASMRSAVRALIRENPARAEELDMAFQLAAGTPINVDGEPESEGPDGDD
jgi:hypothetical protein